MNTTSIKTRNIILGWLVLLGFLFFASLQSVAQSNMYNQRDDEYRLLGLKRALATYEAEKSAFDRSQDLFRRNLISQQQLDQQRAKYADAEVNYQQSMLAVLFEKQYVTVRSAIKYQGENGDKSVKVTLENTTRGSAEFQKLANMEDSLFQALRPDIVNNVYVSLLNESDQIISKPYEQKINELAYGNPKSLTFSLLQDVDAVKVNLIYGSGSTRTLSIFLEKDATQDRVLVQSETFSQEADLGTTASYALSMELFGGSSAPFTPMIFNLPEQIRYTLTDQGSSARMAQIRFTESTNTRKARLDLSLPDRADGNVLMDKAIPFYLAIVPTDKRADFSSGNITEQELKEAEVGFIRLELIPRGVGRIIVKAPQLYLTSDGEETASTRISVTNDGSRRLDNVSISADMPLGWTFSASPDLIGSIETNGENFSTLSFTPPTNVSVGKYEMRVRTSSYADNKPIFGEDKVITVEILPQPNILGTLFLVLLLVGLVGAVIIFGIKLSRR